MQKKQLSLFLITLPPLIWLAVIACYAVNIPWFDDFDPFPDFIRKWNSTPDTLKSLELILAPNNEHRMLSGKLITLGLYKLSGTLNLALIQYIGAAFTLGTCYILYRNFKSIGLPPIYFLPIPLLLFQFQFHLIFLWAICSMQHQTAVFFLCLSMLFLSRKQLTWAIIAALIGNFSFSNGMFIWPAGLVVLLARTDFKSASIWGVASALSIGLYLGTVPTQGNESSLAYNLQHPHMFFIGFWGFLGSILEILPRTNELNIRLILPVIMGAISTSILIIWLLRAAIPLLKTFLTSHDSLTKWELKKRTSSSFQDFTIGLLSFSLVNGLIVGFLRPRFGLDVVLVSNYKLYSALFLITSYLIFLNYFKESSKRQVFFGSSVLLALVIWSTSTWNILPEISERRKYLLINAYNQQHNQFGLGFARNSTAAIYTDSLVKYIQKEGLYQFPTTYQHVFEEMKNTTNKIPNKDFSITQENNELFVSQANSPFSWGKEDGTFLFLRSEKQLYVYKFDQSVYRGKNLLRQFENHKVGKVELAALDPGTYSIGYVSVTKQKLTSNLIETIDIH